jgi:nucleotide-binding universal stress UspA family protein
VRDRYQAPVSVGKMMLGSNAHRILMDSPCPVLTVRAA